MEPKAALHFKVLSIRPCEEKSMRIPVTLLDAVKRNCSQAVAAARLQTHLRIVVSGVSRLLLSTSGLQPNKPGPIVSNTICPSMILGRDTLTLAEDGLVPQYLE